jgi:hypothetical protein
VEKREERDIRLLYGRWKKGQYCDVRRGNREVDDKKGGRYSKVTKTE